MTRQFIFALTAIAALLTAGTAQAAPTLIGDTISFLRAFPDTSTGLAPTIPDTTVAAGPSDEVTWASTSPSTINPEANSITFTFLNPTTYIGLGPSFDGYVIGNLDADIASVSLLSNSSGLNLELTHGLRSIFLDLSGITLVGGSVTFAVNLVGPVSSVPEPSTSVLMAVGAGIALLARRRKPG